MFLELKMHFCGLGEGKKNSTYFYVICSMNINFFSRYQAKQ
jgi:hypothetical protein